MIVLHTFGPAFGLHDASPFVVKTLVHLKMAGQPFALSSKGMFKAPKGKLPYIEDDGEIVADSTFIRWHLERKYGVDLDEGLTTEQRASAWAIEKMMEDNAYWIGVHWRWMDKAAFRKVSEVFLKAIPQPVRWVVELLMRRKIRGYLQAQGMGRHSEEDMLRIARRHFEALESLLGGKPYLMGAKPCGADAITFAMLASCLSPHFESPLKQAVLRHPSLVAYARRMDERFFPAAEGDSHGVPRAAA